MAIEIVDLDFPYVSMAYIYIYIYIYTAWWFGTWMDHFSSQLEIKEKTDELIFFRGFETTNQGF